jgi:Zn finger protein HypA/HybF involved in hydrogenase expression
MIQFKDFKCEHCGHEEKDKPIETNSNSITYCPMCDNQMNTILGGLTIKVPSKTEREYPTKFLNGGDRAKFRKE